MHTRFPVPTEEQVKKDKRGIFWFGPREVFSARCGFLDFCRYVVFPSRSKKLEKYGFNPSTLTEEQLNQPAILFAHCDQGQPGHWLPYASAIQKYGQQFGPLFTFKYKVEATAHIPFFQKLTEIRKQYLAYGQKRVEIIFVGHSLGAILSAEYAFDSEKWIDGFNVKKVISIAGRLKNLEIPHNTPYYGYCYPMLPRIDRLAENMEKYRGDTKLYTIAGGKDTLLPRESVLIGTKCSVIPHAGHLGVLFNPKTVSKVLEYLRE